MQIELTSPAEGEIMQFSGGKWVNAAAPSSMPAANEGQSAQFSGGVWTAIDLPTGAIATIKTEGDDTIFEF